jgi:hypothetical protein
VAAPAHRYDRFCANLPYGPGRTNPHGLVRPTRPHCCVGPRTRTSPVDLGLHGSFLPVWGDIEQFRLLGDWHLATRLCSEARSGQILVEGRVHTAVESLAHMEPAGELVLKGIHRAVRTFNVLAMRDLQSAVS